MPSKTTRSKKHKRPEREAQNDTWGPPQWNPNYGEWGTARVEGYDSAPYGSTGRANVPRRDDGGLAERFQGLDVNDVHQGDDGGQGASDTFQDLGASGPFPGPGHLSTSQYTLSSSHNPSHVDYPEDDFYPDNEPLDRPNLYGGQSHSSSHDPGELVHGHGKGKGKSLPQDHDDSRHVEIIEHYSSHSGSKHPRSKKGKGREQTVGMAMPETIPEDSYPDFSPANNPPSEEFGMHAGYGLGGTADWEQGPVDELSSGYPPHSSDTGRFGGEEDEEAELYDEELQRAMQESRDEAFRAPVGESSVQRINAYGSVSDPWTGASDATTAYDDMQTSTRVPQPMPRTNHIIGTDDDFEDPRYTVVPSSYFQPGSVFKILWSEPRGFASTPGNDIVSDAVTADRNSSFYIGIRRFIVVATDQGHSTCVPILTYEGRACTKPGVRESKHGIVYSQGQKPRLVKNEQVLGYRPVAVRMIAEERLSKESRASYSKLVTIEHNVKVFFIGVIEGNHFNVVQQAVDDCWARKTKHHKSSKRPKKY